MLFSPAAQYVLTKLTEAGYQAYAVGGCVRDLCMGITPHDTDVTTSAKPEQVLKVFGSDRIIETGLKHGTVTVLKDGEPIEVTTYRIDGAYDDNRHPRQVTFTSDLTLDLSRRDFTINAMACGKDGEVIDVFGGRQHIKDRLICCVGDPGARFDEDGLRILRALRFASVLDFDIEANTAKAIRAKRELQRGISRERILSEFTKLLCGVGASRILHDFYDVISIFIDGYTQIDQSALCLCPSHRVLRFATFFAPLYNADKAAEILLSLKCDTKLKIGVKTMLECLHTDFDAMSLLRRLAADDAFALLSLRDAIMPQDAPATSALRQQAQAIIDSGECYCLKMLAVTGRDLMDAGIPAGGGMGEILDELLTLVTTKKLPNQKSQLINHAIKISNI